MHDHNDMKFFLHFQSLRFDGRVQKIEKYAGYSVGYKNKASGLKLE